MGIPVIFRKNKLQKFIQEISRRKFIASFKRDLSKAVLNLFLLAVHVDKSAVKYENMSSKYTHIDSSFIDNIFGADFADMQLISKINQGICFLLCWDVNPRTYIDFNKENSKKSPNFKNGDNVTISKYKHIFDKGYVWNLSG